MISKEQEKWLNTLEVTELPLEEEEKNRILAQVLKRCDILPVQVLEKKKKQNPKIIILVAATLAATLLMGAGYIASRYYDKIYQPIVCSEL